MRIEQFGYALLCIAGPVAWGLLVYWVSKTIEGRIAKKEHAKPVEPDKAPDVIPLDYHI